MNQVIKYKVKNCYLANAEDFILILRFWWFIQQEWIQKVMQNLLVTIVVFHININKSIKYKLINNITVYKSYDVTAQIETIVHDYLCLWEDHDNIVDVFKSDWMNISLLNNWQKKYKFKQIHIYSLKLND